MGTDATENIRREMVKELNAAPKGRAELELKHGRCGTPRSWAETTRSSDSSRPS